jgi:DNA-binding transcriptional regulator YhcF (GntR family)
MLRRRIQWGVHLGLVKVGDRLPSLRAASAEFGVDQRSVLNAYRQLEREGIVEMRPRSGIYVASESQPLAPLSQSARWMSDMFLQGFARGVTPISLGPTLASAINFAPLTAACVECNADQILWMAGQLREEFGLSTVWVEPDMAQTEMAERLRGSDLIVTTAFHTHEARKLGDQFQKPVVVVTAGRDGVTQLRAELGRGPVYFVGTDDRYAKKLLEASDSARWMSNLRPVIVDRTTIGEVPDGSPVFVTQAAANILGDNVPAGATVMDYPFSSESRVEIIAVILAAALKANAGKPSSADPVVR